uniref:Uncharacterized protein n=1 Tax=Panagrolaimus sp. JU765 TaxID=591449 RepID=A0AC34QBW3_9BILA
MDRPNAIVFPLLAPKPDESISALAVDPRRSIVFWSDSINGRIYKLEMLKIDGKPPEQEILSKSGAENCQGMSVDNVQGLLYYTGWNEPDSRNITDSWITVMTIDGRFKKTIIDSKNFDKLKKPVQINYIDGELYWFDVGYSPPLLFRSSSTGKKIVEINLKNLDKNSTIEPKSLIIDGSKRLFWTQPTMNKTRVLELSSMTLHTL